MRLLQSMFSSSYNIIGTHRVPIKEARTFLRTHFFIVFLLYSFFHSSILNKQEPYITLLEYPNDSYLFTTIFHVYYRPLLYYTYSVISFSPMWMKKVEWILLERGINIVSFRRYHFDETSPDEILYLFKM